MPSNFDAVPKYMTDRQQFCVRVDKQPYILNGDRTKLTAKEWTKNKEGWLTFTEATDAVEKGVKVYHKGSMQPVNGIGWLTDRTDVHILGGDIDCCVDPETSLVSPWAKSFIEKAKPFYTEISLSKCGLRFFCKGTLGGRDSVFGTGPQDDLPEDTKKRILEAKPSVAEKIAKGEPAFNGLELYETGRHLTITGLRCDEFCYPMEDQTAAIDSLITMFVIKDGVNKNRAAAAASKGKKGLPELDLLKLIDTSGFERSGGQLMGGNPIIGSTTGQNLVIDPSAGIWANMHNKPPGRAPGGDAWIWLACECGAVSWDDAGAGSLKDRATLERTLEYAVSKGYVTADQVGFKKDDDMPIRKVDYSSDLGSVGLAKDGTIRQVEVKKDDKGKPVTSGQTVLTWVSDCPVYIAVETSARADTEFVFKGRGAVDGREVRFVMPAGEMADPRKFKAAMINAFGGDNRLGKLDFEKVQGMTLQIEKRRRIEIPCWMDGKIMAPGLADDNVEFRFAEKVAIDFRDVGDEDAGVEALKSLLQAFYPCNMSILMAAVFGAPVIAKLWPDERFALLLTGLTGSKKTTVTMLLNSIYGRRYNSESTLVRWGDGATSNAIEHLAAWTGPFVFGLDNYKIYTEKDVPRFQRFIHAVLEGGEKDRLERNSNDLRPSDEYRCLPIVNGENYPGNDAATRARVVQLEWTDPTDISKLIEAQKHVADLNALGKAWCLWLMSDEGKWALKWGVSRFDTTRSRYLKTTSEDAINTGRIATNATLIALVWEILKAWPMMADLADEYSEVLKVAIENHIVESQGDVIDDLDAEKFISWLKSELEVGRYMFSTSPGVVRYRDHYTETIGEYRFNKEVKPPKAEALITPHVFGSMLLPAWQKSVTGVRADKKSLLRQLVKRGYLLYNKKESIFTNARWIEKKTKRVLVFDWVNSTGLNTDDTDDTLQTKNDALTDEM